MTRARVLLVLPFFLLLASGSQGLVDTMPPELLSISIYPRIISTTDSDTTAYVILHIKDDLSGVKYAMVRTIGDQGGGMDGYAGTPLSGDATNGIWRIPLRLPQYSRTGKYTVLLVRLRDRVLNYREYVEPDHRCDGVSVCFPPEMDEESRSFRNVEHLSSVWVPLTIRE